MLDLHKNNQYMEIRRLTKTGKIIATAEKSQCIFKVCTNMCYHANR